MLARCAAAARTAYAATATAAAATAYPSSKNNLFRHFSGAGISQHRETDDNTASRSFDFTPENYEKIKKIRAKFPQNYQQSAVMPLLTLAQEQNDNWLPLSAMNKVAQLLDMAPIRVYEVATFYSMYNRTPVGKFHLQVCGTTPCMLCGAQDIIQTIEKHLHIKSGDTSSDNMFTLSEVECLGACVNAPMMQVNNHEFYENLTPDNTIELLNNLKAGTAKVGPQTNQKNCEGPMGKTSLFEQPKPVCRDFKQLAEQLKAEQEKAKQAAAAAAAAQAAAAPTANKP